MTLTIRRLTAARAILPSFLFIAVATGAVSAQYPPAFDARAGYSVDGVSGPVDGGTSYSPKDANVDENGIGWTVQSNGMGRIGWARGAARAEVRYVGKGNRALTATGTGAVNDTFIVSVPVLYSTAGRMTGRITSYVSGNSPFAVNNAFVNGREVNTPFSSTPGGGSETVAFDVPITFGFEHILTLNAKGEAKQNYNYNSDEPPADPSPYPAEQWTSVGVVWDSITGVFDQFGNAVPFTFHGAGPKPRAADGLLAASEAPTISATIWSASGTDYTQSYVDVADYSKIPEPSAAALLSVSIAFLGGRRRRSNRVV